ncbi:DEP domain containing 1 S homeolog isoform X2 [Xenopus laevis]|uniref:DEP domain-containing protein 1B n=1 Tax=Xenopus laevis TaxID=8355 RepID=A0A8J0V9B5_XENLA|nr:DEP domain containing 1 S homeolog isoform X2 [Xenopus laevis]
MAEGGSLLFVGAGMDSRIITPGPYRAAKLWNEVTKHFRVGMPLTKHRQHFKAYGNYFTASEAIDLLHQLLKTNSNFGSEVTRQQTIQLLRKFLKKHVIEDLKGRWGTEDLEDNNSLYRFPSTSPVKTIPSRPPLWKRSSMENVFKEREHLFKMPQFSKKTTRRRASVDSKNEQENKDLMEEQENDDDFPKQLRSKDIEDIWGNITLIHLQKILGLPSLEEVLNPSQIKPNYIRYNMTHTSKHGVVVLQCKTDDLPHWVLSAMKCLANWPKNNDTSQSTYIGFERDVFRTVADYFLNLPEPLLTFDFYELFVNILGLLQPHLERVAIEALQLCCLLLPPANRRKLQLLMRMISRMSQNVDMPRLHNAMGNRSLLIQTFSRCVLCCAEEVDLDELLASRLVSFLMDHPQDILQVPCYLQTAVQNHIQYLQRPHVKQGTVPAYYFCKQISTQEFEEQKLATSQAAIIELLENIVRDKTLSIKDKKKKLKQFKKQYPDIYQSRFPTRESEAKLFGDKPTIKQPMLMLKKPKFKFLRH